MGLVRIVAMRIVVVTRTMRVGVVRRRTMGIGVVRRKMRMGREEK